MCAARTLLEREGRTALFVATTERHVSRLALAPPIAGRFTSEREAKRTAAREPRRTGLYEVGLRPRRGGRMAAAVFGAQVDLSATAAASAHIVSL